MKHYEYNYVKESDQHKACNRLCSRESNAEKKHDGVDRAIALIYILQNRTLWEDRVQRQVFTEVIIMGNLLVV